MKTTYILYLFYGWCDVLAIFTDLIHVDAHLDVHLITKAVNKFPRVWPKC